MNDPVAYPWMENTVYEPPALPSRRGFFLTRTAFVVLAIAALVIGGSAALVLA